ncbi:MAG: NAD(P)-dependent oxidoreductase [Phycisphaeraceae bacterium]
MPLPTSALVLGASGRIGRRLCESLRDRGLTVHGAARFSDPAVRARLDALGVHTITYSAREDDPAMLPDVPLAFLELWAPAEHSLPDARQRIWSLNYHAVGRVAARYAGQADIINGCSGNVYGTHPEPRAETDPQRPDDEYGLARFAQEKLLDFLCDQRGSGLVHLRYYHANTPESGLVRRLAETIKAGDSLGPNPDERVQVIAMEDFIRCTLAAGERRDALPRAVNVCHPRLWTLRELAERLHAAMGTGAVRFDRDAGGVEHSTTGDATLMREHFGEPTGDVEALIDEVAEAVS